MKAIDVIKALKTEFLIKIGIILCGELFECTHNRADWIKRYEEIKELLDKEVDEIYVENGTITIDLMP